MSKGRRSSVWLSVRRQFDHECVQEGDDPVTPAQRAYLELLDRAAHEHDPEARESIRRGMGAMFELMMEDKARGIPPARGVGYDGDDHEWLARLARRAASPS